MTVVACPQCGAAVTWSGASPYRPFCSRRCRLIDLGEWFNEERRIPGQQVDTDEIDEHDQQDPASIS